MKFYFIFLCCVCELWEVTMNWLEFNASLKKYLSDIQSNPLKPKENLIICSNTWLASTSLKLNTSQPNSSPGSLVV